MDLCSRKTLTGKSRDFRDTIVFEKLFFQNVNSKSAEFRISPVWSVFVKLRFRDGRISVDGRFCYQQN